MRMLVNLKIVMLTVASVATFSLSGANNALAEVEFDQDVTPNVIFGTGNANGGFTTVRNNGIEIGLRGKLRFDENGDPKNIFNSNGDGTYSFAAIVGPTQASPTPEWSFEWSVNTDSEDPDSLGSKLNEFTYEMGLDGDPGPGTDFLVFDPITPPPAPDFFDHDIGDNSTDPEAGVVATSNANYVSLLSTNNVAQNSQRYDFFLSGSLVDFNPKAEGTYAIYLLARDSRGRVAAKVNIQILVGNAKPAPDHFHCYDVNRSTRLDRNKVDLDDQFVWRENVRVDRRAVSFCTPVDKNNEGITNRDNHLTCYKVKGFKPNRKVTIKNQFGEQTLVLEESDLLCVPSVQTDVQDTTKNDDDDDDDDD